MQYVVLAVILWGGLSAPSTTESKPTTRGSLVGTWVKEMSSREGSYNPDSANWDISISYQSDGKFVWHAIHTKHATDNDGIDASTKGTYLVKGAMITYQFDSPSPEALQGLPKFFAYHPKKLRGYHMYQFRDDNLQLWNEGDKICTRFKRKCDEPEKAKSVPPENKETQTSPPKGDEKSVKAPEDKDK